MPRTFKRLLAPLALVLGVICAGAGTYAVGHSIGYDQIAYADDPPLAVVGPAGLVLFDAAPADDAVAATDQVAVPTAPSAAAVDPDGDGPAPGVTDPVEQPSETWTAARYYWSLGGWAFTVFMLLVASTAISVRLTPKDKDGDGKADPEGWKGMTWAITAALAMVLVPVLAVLLKVDGAGVTAIGSSVVAAAALLWSNVNPTRGAKAGV